MGKRGRQIIRQWKVLRALEGARRGLSVAELHELIGRECDRRTIYRDVEQLQAAGFPLVQDEAGHYRVLAPGEGGWTIPLQPTDLMALALTEDLLEPARGTYLADPLRDLRAKLLATMTPAGRGFFDELREASVATLFGPGSYAKHGAVLEAVREAIVKQHVLRIAHAKPNATENQRDVEPYSTWYHVGVLYLIAYCRRREGFLHFNVARIRAATVLDEPFEPDPRFDAAAYARRGFGAFHGSRHDFVVDFSPAVAHLLHERRFHETQRETDLADGGARVTMTAEGLPEVAAWVAGFGGDARPVAPPELVAAVRRLHEEGLARLEGDPELD